MRLSSLIAALVAAAPIGLSAGTAAAQFTDQSILFGRSHVYEGRWCALTDTGAGRVEENCYFDSFEACRLEVISGNRGTCTQNPAFTGGYERPIHKTKKKRRPRR